MFEEVSDLGRRDARERKWRKLIFGEELGVGGFVAVLRRAADEFGEEEDFVSMERVGWMAVEVAVENGGEFGDANLEAGFFAGFASSGDGGWLADIGPATREGPAAVLEFADEEDAAILESGDAHINLGRGIARLLGKKFLQTSGVLARAIGHDLRGDGADLLVALNIEFVLAIC